MKNVIGKLILNINNILFATSVDREIYNRIFPHLEHEKHCGYSFGSDEEFAAQRKCDRSEFNRLVRSIEYNADRMPKAYGEAFRYIAIRDLKARAEMYEQLAHEQIQPETCDPHLVAKRA
jgi:hypothetical protein